MYKEIKQVAWGYVVNADGIRAGAQNMEELNQMLNVIKPKSIQRPNGKAKVRARLGKVNQK